MTISSILDTLTNACSGAGRAAHKTKVRTEIMMIDREITNKQKEFGVTMYDHINPLSKNEDFYATSDGMNDILRVPLLTAQKEVQALANKHATLDRDLAAAVTTRSRSFPIKAETVKDKMSNLGKAGVMYSGETKIKAEMAIADRQMKSHKQTFGLTLFEAMSEAEDTRGFLPADRTMRSIYDQTRGDIHLLIVKKKLKEDELLSLKKSKAAPAAQSSTNANYT